MNYHEANFKKSLSPVVKWTFTENIWTRRVLGLTILPLLILLSIGVCLVILPYLLWNVTLKEMMVAFWEPFTLIKEWL